MADVKVMSFFLPTKKENKQKTYRYEELLRSVYSKETMHAIGGGPGYLWI